MNRQRSGSTSPGFLKSVAALTALAAANIVIAGSPAFAADAGVFSVKCAQSHVASADPIVFPGMTGMSHMHVFFGNATTDADSTYDTMASAGTSCLLSKDTAAYWMPALLDANGNPVAVKNFLAYYRGDSNAITPPADLRLIAGATVGTQISTRQFGWNCSSTPLYQPSFVGLDCGAAWLKAHIAFPSCWDGVLTHENDTSHFAYAPCDKAHPYRLPTLSIHVTFAIHAGSAEYSLSSDAAMGVRGGLSLHADFWNTWQQQSLSTLVEKCLHTGADCKQITDAQLASL